MRVLITGGFGFLGARLGAHLQQVGHEIILGSRSFFDPPSWLPRAKVVQTDWHDDKALFKLCKGVDIVIHTAGMNSSNCAADPIGALQFNGVATARLASAANRAGVKRLIYISTCHVYADPLSGNVSEGVCPTNFHPYATSHLAGEQAVLGLGKSAQIECLVLRLSNAFGAPAHKDVNCWMLLVNDLCRQAVEKRELTLRSSGIQQRDFISMSDFCLVVAQFLDRDLMSEADKILNIGSGHSQTVLEMAELIASRCEFSLGFLPKLIREEGLVGERSAKLFYKLDKYCRYGTVIKNDKNREIDDLLDYCNRVFE